MENGKKHMIKVKYRLDHKPHEIIIADVKYQLKELFIWEGMKSTRVATIWDLHVGAKVDIFGKPTILKKWCLRTTEWNK